MDPELLTARLRLVPNRPELVRAYLTSADELGRVLGVQVPADWPSFPEVFTYVPEAGIVPRFRYYLVISLEHNALIGEVGYKGDPAEPDGVRMAYSTLPAYRQRGYATEALQAVLKHAFADPDLNKVYVGPLGTSAHAEHIMADFGFQVVERYDNDHWWQLMRARRITLPQATPAEPQPA